MLRALRVSLDLGGGSFSFDIFGQGAQESRLRELSRTLHLESVVQFHAAVPFGREFFETLQALDVLLAAPLAQDTPRSALDAQASGQYVLAYDTYYYRDLQASGAAVEVVPWRDVEAMGRALVMLFQDRDRLTLAIERGVAFARQNTQEIWLQRRLTWTRQALQGGTITDAADDVTPKPRRNWIGFQSVFKQP
jgi:glycosyltransferase involved in cell wall biosynthesis